MTGIMTLILICGGMLLVLAPFGANQASLNIKSKTVGDSQHGTARWATKKEVFQTYPYTPQLWRQGQKLPLVEDQGLVVGCVTVGKKTTALVDTSDVHCLMIGAAGVGKAANFLFPNLEYACTSRMSFITSDTKGDLYRNFAGIAQTHYGYNISVIDLRNPAKSDGSNMIALVNKYMDDFKKSPGNLALKSRAEKYAKSTSKTIIESGGGGADRSGQNAYFYDSAEGILTSIILLIAEFCPPKKRHIISVFKIIQDLLALSNVKGKNQFQLLLELEPHDHKAR